MSAKCKVQSAKCKMRVAAIVTAASLFFAPTASVAADNELTPKEKAEGWILLFDGKTTNGWKTSDLKPCRTQVEDGALNPHRSGHYMLIHEKEWSDFILQLDFKISKGCNSGVFFRTWPLTPRPGKDVGFNGLEIAIDDTAPRAEFVDTGALYDLSKPTKNTMKPAGEWNRMKLTVKGAKIEVELNGEVVNRVDLAQFTEQFKRPDGAQHKFDVVYRDHPRHGYIGFQDHGSPCWFKNIKIKPL